MVDFRVYSRNANGKYPLDTSELRDLVLDAEDRASRIDRFRLGRLSRITANAMGFKLPEDCPRIVVHLVPLAKVTFSAEDVPGPILPLASQRIIDTRPNLDGFVYAAGPPNGAVRRSYVQAFRNGAVESAASFISDQLIEKRHFHAPSVANEVAEFVRRAAGEMDASGVPFPVSLMLSVLDVKGYRFRDELRNDRFDEEDYPPPLRTCEHRDLILPDALIQSAGQTGPALKSVMDVLWQSFGVNRCPSTF
jgi:hypothetical protein